jgi:tryptophan halogenase
MEREPQRWIDAGVPETRADVCQVQSTRETTSLLFGRAQPPGPGGEPRALLDRRVMLTPALAKQLAAGLAGVLRDHEARRLLENATPAGSIRSAPTDEDAPAAARPLLQAVRALGIGFGFEKSFKMGATGILEQRVILGVRASLADPQALLGICRAMGMPSEYETLFAQALPEANTVGFGYEGDGRGGGMHKAYLEFWDRLVQRVRGEPGNAAPGELFLGFKWDAADPSRRALARYTCHPLLPVEGIARRLEALYPAGGVSPSLQAAREILALAARRVAGDSFVYVEAAEEGNPRRSFDLNFYKARLPLAELMPALQALCGRYGAGGEALERLAAQAGARPFGHLSGGLGRDGQDFLTVYYELEAL